MIDPILVSRNFGQVCDPSHTMRAEFTVLCKDGALNIDPDTGGIRMDHDGFARATPPCVKAIIRRYWREIDEVIILIDPDIAGKLEHHGGGHQIKDWAIFNGVHDVVSALKIYDVRMFGQVVILKAKHKKDDAVQQSKHPLSNGAIHGAIQISQTKSTHPVIETFDLNTRCAADEAHTKQTFGSRTFVEGITEYRGIVEYNAHRGLKYQVQDHDLALFWTALINGFEFSNSTQRGFLACMRVNIRVYPNKLGYGEGEVYTIENMVHGLGFDDWIDAQPSEDA